MSARTAWLQPLKDIAKISSFYDPRERTGRVKEKLYEPRERMDRLPTAGKGHHQVSHNIDDPEDGPLTQQGT